MEPADQVQPYHRSAFPVQLLRTLPRFLSSVAVRCLETGVHRKEPASPQTLQDLPVYSKGRLTLSWYHTSYYGASTSCQHHSPDLKVTCISPMQLYATSLVMSDHSPSTQSP
jgi:hypothetical protein